MSKRRVSLVLLCVVAAGAVAAGFAIAGKDRGNDKKFEYTIGLWGDCRTPTCRRRRACRT